MKSMGAHDVLLVLLPYCGGYMPSLGLASVQAALRRAGFGARILDLDHAFTIAFPSRVPAESLPLIRDLERWVGDEAYGRVLPAVEPLIRECAETIAATPSCLIGFSVNSFNYATTSDVIRRLRVMGDTRPALLGGTNCFFPPNIEGLFKQADAVVLGEADESVAEFMAWFLGGREGKAPAGTMVRDEAGNPVWTLREGPADLDALPDPDYEGQKWPDGWASPDFPILMSRGCIGRCAFCDVFARNGRFRVRSPERVFAEIRRLRETYPGLRLHFNDSLVNGSPSQLRRVCGLLVDAGLSVPMIGQARARRDMTPEDFELMRRAGFHTVIYGIETGSETVRRLMNKTQGGTLDEVAGCLARTHDAGIHVMVNLIVGFPGETRRELEESADFLIRNRASIDAVATISPMAVLPDSPVYHDPERYGVDPASIYTHAWRTVDGKNTLEEREWRRGWLGTRLRDAGILMGPMVGDLDSCAGREPLALRAARKAKGWLHRLKAPPSRKSG